MTTEHEATGLSPKLVTRILALITEGRDFHCGPHGGTLGGFYALFALPQTPKCRRCGSPELEWSECGHAWTLQGAIRMAVARIDGVRVTIPWPHDFEEASDAHHVPV